MKLAEYSAQLATIYRGILGVIKKITHEPVLADHYRGKIATYLDNALRVHEQHAKYTRWLAAAGMFVYPPDQPQWVLWTGCANIERATKLDYWYTLQYTTRHILAIKPRLATGSLLRSGAGTNGGSGATERTSTAIDAVHRSEQTSYRDALLMMKISKSASIEAIESAGESPARDSRADDPVGNENAPKRRRPRGGKKSRQKREARAARAEHERAHDRERNPTSEHSNTNENERAQDGVPKRKTSNVKITTYRAVEPVTPVNTPGDTVHDTVDDINTDKLVQIEWKKPTFAQALVGAHSVMQHDTQSSATSAAREKALDDAKKVIAQLADGDIDWAADLSE